MEFKYITVCVILCLIYDTIEANPIRHLTRLDKFMEYDILDIIINSKKSDVKLRRSHPGIETSSKQAYNPSIPAFIKIHHGTSSRNEYTLSTSSSPAFKSHSNLSVSEIKVNDTDLTSVKCCNAITSPAIVKQVNTTQTVDNID